MAVLVIAAVLPFVLHTFFIFQMTLVLVYAIAIIGLNLLTGFNGQFSLGTPRSTPSAPTRRPS